jgi:hypothetical protein
VRLFRKKKLQLTDIYKKYDINRMTYGGNLFDLIPDETKEYKSQILEFFDDSIQNSDSKKLSFCIGASFRDGIDSDYIIFFERTILADWHEEHEDIVGIIYQFKDDRFSNALNEIALNESKYRKNDTELESTLRKCVHALKAINSERSNEILVNLRKTKNPNIEFALEVYNE